MRERIALVDVSPVTQASSPRLVVHVGPPKTATTSLQVCLQDLQVSGFFYAGTSQPRGQSPLIAGQLYREVCLGTNRMAGGVFREILEKLGAGLSVVVSEEMFLVDSGELSHQMKMQRLAELLQSYQRELSAYPVFLAITLRDPIAGLQSLYAELFKSLPKLQRKSFKNFLANNQATVFDYQRLYTLFGSIGFREILCLDFDRLVAAELALDHLTGDERHKHVQLTLSRQNVGKVTKSGERKIEGYSLGHWLSPKELLGDKAYALLRNMPLVGSSWQKLRRVPVPINKSRNVNFPEERANELRRHFLALKP